MQVVEKLTHVAHTFLLRTKLTVNEQSDLLYALIPKLVIRIISQRYVFSYFHSYDIVPWKCNTLHLKAYKAKYPLTLDFMNFEWLSKTSVCLFSSCRFLLSSDAAFLRLSIWQKNERIYYWWYWNQVENIGKMVLLNKVTFNLWHFLYSLGNKSFRYKLFRYELK